MKKLVLSLAILTTVSFSSFANTFNDRNSHRGRKSPMKELNLTTEQQEKIKSINDDYNTKRKELSNNHQKDVNAILTPDQQTKWKELKEKRFRGDRSNRKGLAHKGKRGNREMRFDIETSTKLEALKADFIKDKKSIELTKVSPEEQKRRINELRDRYRNNRREVIKKCKAR